MNYLWTDDRIKFAFWRFVDITDHGMLWSGEQNNKGYGVVRYWHEGKTRKLYAHRFILSEIEGVDIAGKVVMHACDIPLCVTPDHLTPGTQADNMRDMITKSRMDQSGLNAGRTGTKRARGVQKWTAKLTEQQVLEVRQKRSEGVPVVQIALEYGVTTRNIYNIVNRKIWTHV